MAKRKDKMQRSISMDKELWDRIDRLAAEQRRSRSSMLAWLADQAMEMQHGRPEGEA